MPDNPTPALTPAAFRDACWALRPEMRPTLREVLLGGHLMGPELAHLVAEEASTTRPLAALPEEQVVQAPGVAVIPLRGVITPRASLLSLLFGGGAGLVTFRDWFRGALADDSVGSILIDVDSPGGSTDLVRETADEIRAARGAKPITAIANTTMASAAYWIGSAADELVVTPSGEVGSIGTYMLHWDESQLNEKLGVVPTYISSPPQKTDGNPDEPLSDSARAWFQEIVDTHQAAFVAGVAAGRGVDEATVRGASFGQGHTLMAEAAVAAGMADRVATFEQTVLELTGGAEAQPVQATNQRRDLVALQLAQPRRI